MQRWFFPSRSKNGLTIGTHRRTPIQSAERYGRIVVSDQRHSQKCGKCLLLEDVRLNTSNTLIEQPDPHVVTNHSSAMDLLDRAENESRGEVALERPGEPCELKETIFN